MFRDWGWAAGSALLVGCYSASSGRSSSSRAISDSVPAAACESTVEFVPLATIAESDDSWQVLATTDRQIFWSSWHDVTGGPIFHWSAEQGMTSLDPQLWAPSQLQLRSISKDGKLAVITSFDSLGEVTGGFLWSGSEPLEFGLVPDVLNFDGTVIAGRTSGELPARWTEASGVQVLGARNAGMGLLSAAGDVMAGDDGEGRCQRWTEASGFEDLGELAPRQYSCSVLCMNDAGDVLFGWAPGPDTDEWQPFRWTPASGMVNLQLSRRGVQATPQLASADGSVSVNAISSGADSDLSRWTEATGARELQIGSSPIPHYLSPAGDVLIGELLDLAAQGVAGNAFRWTEADGVQELGMALEPGGIAVDGKLIVGNGPTGPQILRFGELGAGAALIDQLPPGIVPEGWSTPRLHGVSADGGLLFGEARDPQGARRAWLQHLSPRCSEP